MNINYITGAFMSEIINKDNINDILGEDLPVVMPALALRGMTVFPKMILHFDVGRSKSVAALNYAMKLDQSIFLIAQKEIKTDDPEEKDLYVTGCVSKIKQILKLPGDNIRVLVEGRQRAKLLKIVKREPHIEALVKIIPEAFSKVTPRLEALMREAKNLFEDFSSLMPGLSNEVLMNVLDADNPDYLSDYIAQNIPVKHSDKQEILETINPAKRLEKIVNILDSEIEILEIEHDIQDKVKRQLDKNQKDYFLREQMKVIQNELGDGDDLWTEVNEYREKIAAINTSAENKERLLKECDRLYKMPSGSHEGAVIRTYLDTCIELPWNYKTKDKVDIKSAKKMLDRDHYGMQKVKERILEFIAVKMLAPELRGQILCLVGPPGVGKTSIGQSIARALGRNFARLSLGGIRDEADIRGHRKTYIGSMPGRIISAVKQAKSKNPVLLLDEVDKLGNDFRGDPAAALLEVLDPEQNSSFRDHFIELPFDLSDVLFITTANTTDTIPNALLDRMETIFLTSYTDEEKLHIAKGFLVPKQLKKHGLKKPMLKLDDSVLLELIDGYTRESGVRNLEREIAAICRKSAKLIAETGVKSVKIDTEKLSEMLGVKRYLQDRLGEKDEVGVVNGLAWTSVGGELLQAEVNVVAGTGKIELTGHLGDVMKESAKAAITYIRSIADRLGIDPKFYEKSDIHIHFPEGAIPKDGPSAGITIATALVSALTLRPVKRDVAMTGEITLRGRVLPIGGLKEKTMAAYRAGIKTIILPALNRKDVEELDKVVTDNVRFIFADKMDIVIENAIEIPVMDINRINPLTPVSAVIESGEQGYQQLTQ